ncbi:hypothetical protein PhaeoP71_01871 [Phaeobacter piscinae]|nr:hypothetical protein [Phaeobacter piscinae]AUQ74732.1 hypothetical protein PhaeoP71_01871 [Phaeobacter piscinae]
MLLHQNFLDILSTISLPVSVAGPSHSGLPGGPIAAQSGPDPVHANLSARQAKALGLTTSATSGRPSNGSFASATLQLSMENRLRERLGVNGSPWCGLIWKRQDMPWGPPISRLARSGRGTNAPGITGLPTPSGCSNGGKNHVVGRLDEWGGSSNPFRGTEVGKKRCGSFEAWMMGYPMVWASLMAFEMQSSHRSRKRT